MNEPKQLIKLASAHVTQLSTSGIKTPWSVKANITEEKLFELPNHFNEGEVFAILNFARKYELEALNIGINFQKEKNNGFLQEKIDNQLKLIEALTEENERLSGVLDNITKGK